MKTPEEIFKQQYSNTFDLAFGFEGAFLQVAKTVAEEYADQFKMDWYSITYELPKDGDLLLVWDGQVIRRSFYHQSDFYCCQTMKPIYDATHWVFFPEPPK